MYKNEASGRRNKYDQNCRHQGRIQAGLTGLYKPVRFSKERKSITFHVYN
jgi:starvation-inducible outer membrane lipoprotein